MAKQTQASADPLVTIVTPAYNQADYLPETIESVLAQDYQNLEYIVLDDGSTDGTPDVLARYGDRLKWERHENMGQSRTLNKGWSMAKGDVVAYLSSDDRLLPTAVSTAVGTLLSTPAAIMAYCDFHLIDEAGRVIGTRRTEDFSRRRLEEDLVCQPGPGAFLWKRVLTETGGWSTDLKQLPDFEFWLRLARLGDFVRIPQPLAEYRIHSSSASFRPTDRDRADEVLRVMRNYWAGIDSAVSRRSLALASIRAARHHFHARRFRDGLTRIGSAVRTDPSGALTLRYWHPILAGLFRRQYRILRGDVPR